MYSELKWEYSTIWVAILVTNRARSEFIILECKQTRKWKEKGVDGTPICHVVGGIW